MANEPAPRILTVGPEPGVPLLITFTPATLPCIAVIGDVEGTELISADLITVIGDVKSFAFAAQ